MTTLSRIGLLLLLCLFTSGCPVEGVDVKVYMLDPKEDALIRKQSNEKIMVKDSKDFYCMSKDDFGRLIDAYRECLENK